MAVNLAFVTYETPFAPCGGIAAVMKSLPAQVKKASGLNTVVFTPFHYKNKKTSSLASEMSLIGKVTVPYLWERIQVKVYRYTSSDELSWYFLLPEDDRFFAGKDHPYDLKAEDLVRDSLFFGAAVARALGIVSPGTYWTLFMQDWEAATTALSLAGKGRGCKLFLTLHNSYDSGGIGIDLLSRVGINSEDCPGGSLKATVLERVLPLVEWPVLTVSGQYARDMTEDILSAGIMAPHLQNSLKPRLRGIDNGIFEHLSLSNDIIAKAERGDSKLLCDWKAGKREKFIKITGAIRSTKEKPVWGDFKKFKVNDFPWFFMAGRDDPRQKGYDIAVRAIREFLNNGGEGRFLFFPIPGCEGVEGLNFLEKLSLDFPESVLAFPFRLEKGYMEALQGATYGIMPSLYEPFGMANEFYLNGTVGIARATGGLLQQIVPLRKTKLFNDDLRVRTEYWHKDSAQPTGILYREREEIPTAVRDWEGINAAGYYFYGENPDRITEREKYPLFRLMADELLLGIKEGVRIYQEEPEVYYKMLAAGIAYIQKNFSWERAASEYVSTVFSWERAASDLKD